MSVNGKLPPTNEGTALIVVTYGVSSAMEGFPFVVWSAGLRRTPGFAYSVHTRKRLLGAICILTTSRRRRDTDGADLQMNVATPYDVQT
jgi:hypothetical protein